MSDNRKSKGKLDALSKEHQEMIFDHCEPAGFNLAAGSSWLKAEFDIELSPQRLGKWLDKIRNQQKNAAQLDALLAKIKNTTAACDPILQAAQSNKALLAASEVAAHGLLAAQLSGDEAKIKFYSDVLVTVVKPALKVADIEAKRDQITLESEKFKASIRTKIEAGLEELSKEIQGNPRALAKYKELKEELAKAA